MSDPTGTQPPQLYSGFASISREVESRPSDQGLFDVRSVRALGRILFQQDPHAFPVFVGWVVSAGNLSGGRARYQR